MYGKSKLHRPLLFECSKNQRTTTLSLSGRDFRKYLSHVLLATKEIEAQTYQETCGRLNMMRTPQRI